ncbi:MAG TPA: hypothetical protein VFI02_11765 [Armatimonadota bacterium]|nr:hypothetical protein [Armatimonadota bacterium]
MRILCAVIIIGMMLGIPAAAEYGNMEQMHMWNVRAGVFFPQGDTVDSSEFTLGIEHEHPATAIIKGIPGFFSLTIDWTRITTTTPTGNDDVTLIPILFNWKQHTGTMDRFWDYGAGIGWYWARDDIPDMNLTKGSKLAWQVMLAYHFNAAYFVEGRYMADGHPSDSGLFGVDVGYTF